MLIINFLISLVKAVSFRREFKTLFIRVFVIILLYSVFIAHVTTQLTYIEYGIGIYNGLFLSYDLSSLIFVQSFILVVSPNKSYIILRQYRGNKISHIYTTCLVRFVFTSSKNSMKQNIWFRWFLGTEFSDTRVLLK